MSIRENIQEILAEIENSAQKAGRRAEDVQLLAVSKTVEAQRIQQAMDAGLTAFGENRVQEWKEKYEILPKNISWHIIGRLQKNKIKYIINKIELLHSLCTLEVAQEIERLSAREGVRTNCLVQVNIGREESKAGVEQEELECFLEQLQGFSHIKVQGLMAIAPFAENPEDVRCYFAKMRELYEKMPNEGNLERKFLSMGMSGDYKIAIEEGANIVRVGSSIFGARDYH
ncbi:MAG: YggS family pyridoxal phosphate-dependent enzyme [Clostridiales bacterium]|nr:YggS family pyridoxal phosphate-dependent enzyme [Clostridiales bacterium]